MSIFLVDIRAALANGLTLRPIRNMVNHETSEAFFTDLEIPAANLIGEEGKGFRYILDGLNAERTLIAAECIGDGRWFVERATSYANERVVFGRPIGQNQGVQFPIAKAYASMRAAELMVKEATRKYEAGLDCGAEANMAKMLAADAAWDAANALPLNPLPASRSRLPAILQKVIAQWRNRIETTFKEITDQMELARHGAHTFWGLLTRTAATIAAHTLMRVRFAANDQLT